MKFLNECAKLTEKPNVEKSVRGSTRNRGDARRFTRAAKLIYLPGYM